MADFCSLTDDAIREAIATAKRRVFLVAPGISNSVAMTVAERADQISVRVVIDPDPHACRLGLGEFEGLALLQNQGVDIRKTPDLRIGVLLIDDHAWVYSPTLLVAEEPASRKTVNAVVVGAAEVASILAALGETLPEDVSPSSECLSEGPIPPSGLAGTPKPASGPETKSGQQIGVYRLTEGDLRHSQEDLAARPPKQFDVVRQSLVYIAHVQFVELSLQRVHIERRTIRVPDSLLTLSDEPEFRRRFRSSFRLIQKGSRLSAQLLEEHRRRIENTYVRKLGRRFGNVILLSRKEDFRSAVKKLSSEVNKHKESITENLEEEIAKSKDLLIDALLPTARRNPPEGLRGQVSTDQIPDDILRRYIEVELEGEIPSPEEIVKGMRLECDFKDVTLEMLNDAEFQAAIREAFPYEHMDRPFTEQPVLIERDEPGEPDA